MLMKELLVHYPVTIVTEINSASALYLIEHEDFDLVLTDIQMPIMDGFELVKQIRQHMNPKITDMPAIALSGKRDLAPQDYINRGFTAHHPKPIQLEQLLELMAGIFSESLVADVAISQPVISGTLYNLSSLSQFTYNDPDALRAILETFIDSVTDNCKAMQEAAKANDEDMVAQLAHKMIPMLRQMEVHSIAERLFPLEDRNITLDAAELQLYIDDICSRLSELCEKLEGEMV